MLLVRRTSLSMNSLKFSNQIHHNSCGISQHGSKHDLKDHLINLKDISNYPMQFSHSISLIIRSRSLNFQLYYEEEFCIHD